MELGPTPKVRNLEVLRRIGRDIEENKVICKGEGLHHEETSQKISTVQSEEVEPEVDRMEVDKPLVEKVIQGSMP